MDRGLLAGHSKQSAINSGFAGLRNDHRDHPSNGSSMIRIIQMVAEPPAYACASFNRRLTKILSAGHSAVLLFIEGDGYKKKAFRNININNLQA